MPVDVGDVAAGVDVLIVAIPEKAVPQLPAAVLDGLADGAAVIDTGNYYPQRDGRIADIENGMPESKWVQQQLGHPVVKAFNGVHAAALIERAQPTGSPGRLAVAIASDESVAKATVMQLIDELGFDSVDAGGIDESWRMQPGTPWYGQGLDADGVRKALAQAQPERPAELRALVGA